MLESNINNKNSSGAMYWSFVALVFIPVLYCISMVSLCLLIRNCWFLVVMSRTIFFNRMVTVHIKPTAPHHPTGLTASMKKIQLPVLSHTLFLLDYRKTWAKIEPWPKVDVLPYIVLLGHP